MSGSAPEAARRTCMNCGYVYHPECGDPEGGISPGTPFDTLPGGWCCPVCDSGKDDFQ